MVENLVRVLYLLGGGGSSLARRRPKGQIKHMVETTDLQAGLRRTIRELISC